MKHEMDFDKLRKSLTYMYTDAIHIKYASACFQKIYSVVKYMFKADASGTRGYFY